MTTYKDLDINQKIQTKAALKAWLKYAIEHFKEQLDRKVYRFRNTQRGRIQGNKKASGELKRNWYQTLVAGAAVDRIMIEFMLYGRFVDMGVGRGTTHTDRRVAQELRLGKVARKRKAWYSKRKTHEVLRLKEILAEQNIHLSFDAMETALTLAVKINI